MNIKVKYFGLFEDLAGRSEDVIELEHDNLFIEDLINLLSEKYGAKFRNTLIDSKTKQLKEGCILFLNNMKGNLDQPIKDGDILYLLPILAGG